jgi:hypothetical protein
MDEIWLDNDLIQQAIKELNPDLPMTKGRDYDANWENLRREKPNPFDKTVKTKTPSLLEHPKNFSFVYRRYDGAHWHTELRDIDVEFAPTGLTGNQKKLKENIDTIFAIKSVDAKLIWITPTNKSGDFDPRYQLVRLGNEWLCCINDALYECSNSRKQDYKEYVEHTFSTKNQPLFTLESTEAILDRIIK